MSEVTIRARHNGPYMVTGKVTLTDADGNPYEVKETFYLCRCGGSANKPFCDGTHKRNGFVAEERARQTQEASS